MTDETRNLIEEMVRAGLMSVERAAQLREGLETRSEGIGPSQDPRTRVGTGLENTERMDVGGADFGLGHGQGAAVSAGEPRGALRARSSVGVASRFGEFLVVGELGTGGMGSVYLARHQWLDRVVALKLIRMEVLNSPDAVRRFLREVRAIGKIAHPNVVAAYHAGKQGDVYYLAMEYVQGTNLKDLAKLEGPLSPGRAVRFIAQAAAGLEHAHRCGIIHRDVKPSNLMLSRDKRIKVLDLGLARFKDSDSTATRSGLVGTPDYMSPEQCSDALEADARSDIYSLGCTFFFICTGRHVFANRANVFQKIYAHVHEPPPSIRQLRPDASSRLDAIYRKMVAKKPEDRFASMAEVIHALKSLKRGTPRHRQQAAASSRASRRRSSSLSSTAGRSLTAANAGAADSIATLRLASGPPLAPELTNDLGMRLVWLPGGDFHLGSPDSDPNANADEKPRRLIRVPGFFLADRQVTQGQYRALAGRNPSHFQKSDDHPVDKVSWFEAVRFCNALSHREGLPPFYAIGSGGSRAQVEILGGEGYRLPSEIEWEYACRAGSSTIYPFGDDPDPERLAECAVFGRKIDDGHDPVGGRAANAFGLADMLGNVWEWCWDWHDDHAYQCDPLSAWGPPQGAARVLRGGCYYDAARTVRPAARLKFDPEQRGWLGRDVGFRAARSLAGM